MRQVRLVFVMLLVLAGCESYAPDEGPDVAVPAEDVAAGDAVLPANADGSAATTDVEIGADTISVADASPGADAVTDAAPDMAPDADEDTAPDVGDPVDDDWDDDGALNDEDCAPRDGSVYPGAAERCNGEDDNCDGVADEDVAPQPCETCNDLGCCPGASFCVGGEERCDARIPDWEVINGIDDDCDGITDTGPLCDGHCPEEEPDDGIDDCLDPDDDNDGVLDEDDNCVCGYNPDQENLCDNDDLGDICDPDQDDDGVPNDFDCEPCDAAIHPGATEVCNYLDDNCDGVTDEGWNPCGYLVDLVDCVTSDSDSDGVRDRDDNCPCSYNPAGSDGTQADHDDDGRGDVCDDDDDDDGVPDLEDNCPPRPQPRVRRTTATTTPSATSATTTGTTTAS